MIISKEVAIVLAILWYIKVELLRTKQLPSYITYTNMDRIPKLKADIQKQASRVYSNMYRKNDKVNNFFMADTGSSYLDGKVAGSARMMPLDAVMLHMFVRQVNGTLAS